MHATHNFDTVIIGAGLAGLSAARTLEEFNRTLRKEDRVEYAVLEASDKIGGRVQSNTLETPEGRRVTVETGAQWAHKDIEPGTPENALIPNIQQADRLEHDDMPRQFWYRGQPVSYNSMIRRVQQAREVIRQYRGPDTDLATLFDEDNLGGTTASALITTFGPAETGAPLHQVSVEDLREIVSRNMGEFSRGGLSKFVQQYAKPVEAHIQRNTPISKICWKQDGDCPVEIHAANGDIYRAKHCVITVSVGVLKSGAIAFEPPLPEDFRENLSHISMAHFNKLHLVFDSRFKFPVNKNTHLDVHTKSGEDIFYLARVNGQPVVTAFMGDELAKLCDSDPDRAREIALRGLAEIWGEKIRDHIACTEATQWGGNPFVQGGYSMVDIGHYAVREKLAEPIGNTLFFAGEAMGARDPRSGRDWATHMTGAAFSGERAANLVIQAIEKENPLPYRRFVNGSMPAGQARQTS